MMKSIWEINESALSHLNDSYYKIKSDGSLETEEVFTPIPTDIIITCDQPLSIEESEFLNKVMSSVKKSPTQFTVVDTYNINDVNKGQTYLSFGLPIDNHTQYVIQDDNGSKRCWFDSIPAIMKDIQKKKQLWDCLKSMF